MYTHEQALADANAISGYTEHAKQQLDNVSPIKAVCKEQLCAVIDRQLRNAEVRPVVMETVVKYIDTYPINTKPLREDQTQRRLVDNKIGAMHQLIATGDYEVTPKAKSLLDEYARLHAATTDVLNQLADLW